MFFLETERRSPTSKMVWVLCLINILNEAGVKTGGRSYGSWRGTQLFPSHDLQNEWNGNARSCWIHHTTLYAIRTIIEWWEADCSIEAGRLYWYEGQAFVMVQCQLHSFQKWSWNLESGQQTKNPIFNSAWKLWTIAKVGQGISPPKMLSSITSKWITMRSTERLGQQWMFSSSARQEHSGWHRDIRTI